MRRRAHELELEAADWLEQLYTADFAIAAFFISLITAYGAMEIQPHTQRLCGRLQPLRLLRFFIRDAPTGLTYQCAPPGRTVLLTVWRVAKLPEDCERERAQRALIGCARHDASRHRGWDELLDRRMAEPGAAETYQAAAQAFAFGQRVRLRRVRGEMSVGHLAAAARTTDDFITRCEAGGLMPGTPVAARIADVLNLEPLPQPRRGRSPAPDPAKEPWKRRH